MGCWMPSSATLRHSGTDADSPFDLSTVNSGQTGVTMCLTTNQNTTLVVVNAVN